MILDEESFWDFTIQVAKSEIWKNKINIFPA